jgi:hypothetical protein
LGAEIGADRRFRQNSLYFSLFKQTRWETGSSRTSVTGDFLNEREALECGGRLHLVSRYALSLLMLDWDYKLHPLFDDFCRGLMAYKHTPDYLRDDPDLQREFPPQPLAGLSDLRWRTAERIRDYELMEVRARECGLIWANGRTVLASVFLRPRGCSKIEKTSLVSTMA